MSVTIISASAGLQCETIPGWRNEHFLTVMGMTHSMLVTFAVDDDDRDHDVQTAVHATRPVKKNKD